MMCGGNGPSSSGAVNPYPELLPEAYPEELPPESQAPAAAAAPAVAPAAPAPVDPNVYPDYLPPAGTQASGYTATTTPQAPAAPVANPGTSRFAAQAPTWTPPQAQQQPAPMPAPTAGGLPATGSTPPQTPDHPLVISNASPLDIPAGQTYDQIKDTIAQRIVDEMNSQGILDPTRINFGAVTVTSGELSDGEYVQMVGELREEFGVEVCGSFVFFNGDSHALDGVTTFQTRTEGVDAATQEESFRTSIAHLAPRGTDINFEWIARERVDGESPAMLPLR